jgi:hypothetical protein
MSDDMSDDKLPQKSPEASAASQGLFLTNRGNCYQAIVAGKNSAKRSS